MAQPKSINVIENPKRLSLAWPDGHESLFTFPVLRKACPCAACKGERTPLDPQPLALPAFPNLPTGSVDIKELFPVGRYALGIRWKDGHDSGIYTWDYLRKMCPCVECAG